MNMYADAAVFELKGSSHDAALRLYSLLYKTGNVCSFNPALRPIFEKHANDRLSAIGQNSPSVQVYKDKNGTRGAYEGRPVCFAASTGKDIHFILVAPKNYKGEHFTPAEADLLIGKKRDFALYDMSQTTSIILPSFCNRVAVPDDFDESIHLLRHEPDQYQFIDAWLNLYGSQKP